MSKSTWNSRIPSLLSQLDRRLERDMMDTSHSLRGRMRANAPSPEKGNPYSLGATKEAIAIESPTFSDYDERIEAAKLKRPDIIHGKILDKPILPTITQHTYHALTYDPLLYGIFLEYGTSNMAPQPFAGPSAVEEWPHMVERVRQSIVDTIK